MLRNYFCCHRDTHECRFKGVQTLTVSHWSLWRVLEDEFLCFLLFKKIIAIVNLTSFATCLLTEACTLTLTQIIFLNISFIGDSMNFVYIFLKLYVSFRKSQQSASYVVSEPSSTYISHLVKRGWKATIVLEKFLYLLNACFIWMLKEIFPFS